MNSAFARILPDGKRLHLQQGPIDLVIDADGDEAEVALAFEQAMRAFEPVLTDLVAELEVLRKVLAPHSSTVMRGLDPRTHAFGEQVCQKANFLSSASSSNDQSSAPEDKCRQDVGTRVKHGHDGRGVQFYDPNKSNPVANIMTSAAANFAAHNVSPMIAVAGSVADYILDKMLAGRTLNRVYVNNGGDISLYLNDGHSFDIGIVDRVDAPEISATAHITSNDTVRGVATSGWGGRSFSLGVADAVTVLAPTAALADAAATLIANEVDPGPCFEISRTPAHDLDPDSDLGARLVTTDVQPLSARQKDLALQRGQDLARTFVRDGLITAAALSLQGSTRMAGDLNPKISLNNNVAPNNPDPEKKYARG